MEPPAIPHILISLKDLAVMEECNPDKLALGGINFYKWRRVSELVHDIISYQLMPYPTITNSALEFYVVKNIQVSTGLGEDGIYKLSKKHPNNLWHYY